MVRDSELCGHDLNGFDVWALRRSKSEKLGYAGQCLSLMPRQANDALRTKSECHVDDSLCGYLCMTTPAAVWFLSLELLFHEHLKYGERFGRRIKSSQFTEASITTYRVRHSGRRCLPKEWSVASTSRPTDW